MNGHLADESRSSSMVVAAVCIMTSSSERKSAALPHSDPGLGVQATRGMAWMMTQTIGVKLVSFLSLIVLSRWLAVDDFGLVGMAYTVMSIAGIVQFIGMQDVLVQRHRHFRRWANAAFWLSLTVGLAGGAMILASAPLAASIFDEPRLVPLLSLLAIASPLQTLCVVPQAKLAAELRFRTSVIISSAHAIGISVLSMLLAWGGWGALSFLAPLPIMNGLLLIALWWAARPTVKRSPQLRRWKYLLPDTGFNWGVTVCTVIITTVDHVALGRLFGTHAVGVYFNAVNLSTQVQRLLNTNLMNVLLPSLSRLNHDPQRQINAFLQATRVLTAVMVPACVLQAVLASPLVRLLIAEKWNAAAPVMAILSLGLAFSFIAGPSTSLMKAQGRFRAVFFLHLMQALLTVAAVIFAALQTSQEKAPVAIAWGYSICLILFGPIFLQAAIWPSGLRWRSVGRPFAAPLVVSAAAIGLGRAIVALLPDMNPRDHDLAEIIITTVVGGVAYLALFPRVDGSTWNFVRERILNLRGRRS